MSLQWDCGQILLSYICFFLIFYIFCKKYVSFYDWRKKIVITNMKLLSYQGLNFLLLICSIKNSMFHSEGQVLLRYSPSLFLPAPHSVENLNEENWGKTKQGCPNQMLIAIQMVARLIIAQLQTYPDGTEGEQRPYIKFIGVLSFTHWAPFHSFTWLAQMPYSCSSSVESTWHEPSG